MEVDPFIAPYIVYESNSNKFKYNGQQIEGLLERKIVETDIFITLTSGQRKYKQKVVLLPNPEESAEAGTSTESVTTKADGEPENIETISTQSSHELTATQKNSFLPPPVIRRDQSVDDYYSELA